MDNLNYNPTRQTSGLSKKQNHFNNYNYNVNLIREKASGKWATILEMLGVPASYLKNKHGPCLICRGGKDRFRFDDKGKGLYFCNKCGPGDGFKLLQLCYGWSFSYALNCVARVLGHHHNVEPQYVSHYIKKIMHPAVNADEKVFKRKKYINSIWHSAKTISQNDPVDCYLKARGIDLVDFPSVLRFHRALPYYDEEQKLIGYFPAMLGMVQENSGQYVSIHRTYLGKNCKADLPNPKKLMTPIYPGATQGAAIKLFEPINGKLALAEGIETALAFHVATQMPVWATISASGMEKIKIPVSVTEITIAVDHDESGRGQKAAAVLAQRLLADGRTVRRVMPPKIGYDFTDMLVEESQ